MKKIKNLKDLHAEKLRLQLELIEAEESLRDDLEWVKEEIKPLNVVGRLVSSVSGKNLGGLMNSGVGLTIDAILRNLILAKSGWITKLIVPLIVKNVSSGILSEKKPEIFGMLRNIIQKARKSIHRDKDHYDKSTVDEMDY